MSMFCYQCQETAMGTGCTLKGVCGKTSEVANLQDLLLFVVRGIAVYNEHLRKDGHPSEQADKFIYDALFITITNANFDKVAITEKIKEGLKLKKELANKVKIENAPDECLWNGSEDEFEEKSKTVGVLRTSNEDIRSLKELVHYGLKGMAAYVEHAHNPFLDPPKQSAASAIKQLHEHGIEIKILSGDNDAVVRTIARQVGIRTDNALTGPIFETMSEEEKMKAVNQTTVFSKLTPIQKTEIITLLQAQQHTVGFLGDGINDAAALRQSDIGISVDSAVDIAKESADIILLEKSLMVLEDGVLEGRKTFGNITKYIKMTASSNFGNMFSVMAASAFLPFLPMLPIHLLIQNLLYDISQTTIPFDRMDAEYLRKPRKWDASDLSRFMIFIGPISSIFDIVTYLVMWYAFGCQSMEHQTLFQSGWFIEGLLSQTLIVHMIRTRKLPFIQSCASWQVTGLTLLIMAIGILLPFTPFGSSIGLEALPLSYFPWLFGILLSYCILTQLIKNWYIHRFTKWL